MTLVIKKRAYIAVAVACSVMLTVLASGLAGDPPLQVPTTLEDFMVGGSPWGQNYQEFLSSDNCGLCHGSYDENILIMKPWQGSMHAQAGRDPLFFACLAISEQDAAGVGDFCMHCHTPRAWLNGRALETDGSGLNESDRDGINCHFCHLLVDPFYKPGISPVEDEYVLDRIEQLPVTIQNANFVIDRFDRRRGKRGITDPQPHSQVVAPFISESAICESCHDISNPNFDRQPDDTYVGNDFGESHATTNKYDMFPLERTSSEWKKSDYATKGVEVGDRYGGNKTVMRTCQDCHMPYSTSRSADLPDGFPVHDDLAVHGSVGGNTFAPRMIANLYPDEVDLEAIEATIIRSRAILRAAATLEVTQSGDAINVRLINEGGHKLPTGMTSGRRMWINVKFFDGDGTLIGEHGAYDPETAELTENTEVYQQVLGVDEAVATAVGLPVGPTHHGAYCNVIYKDNRIPPRGFTNANYREIQSPPVGAGYSDGQYWDDVRFMPPVGTASVAVRVFYQTLSKDYVEFLRDANFTNDAGDILYEQWTLAGKSAPEEMVAQTIDLAEFVYGDMDGDLDADLGDHAVLLPCLAGPESGLVTVMCEPGDLDSDNDVDLRDVGRFQRRFGAVD